MAVSLPQRLQDAALRCGQSKEGEQVTEAAHEFVEILEAALDDAGLEGTGEGNRLACQELLQLAMALLDPSTASGLVLLERVGWELPSVVVKYVSLSEPCRDCSDSIMRAVAETCDPREVFTGFMEALNKFSSVQTLAFCVPLIRGLSVVFPRLQRRQAWFFKEANPGLLAVIRLAMKVGEDFMEVDEAGGPSLESLPSLGSRLVSKTVSYEEVCTEIIQVARAVRDTCQSLQEEQRQILQHLLGLFTLELLAIVGGGLELESSSSEALAVVVQITELLPFCSISLCLLLTCNPVEALMESTVDEDDSHRKSQIRKGAALAVYWGLSKPEVAAAAGESIESLKDKLKMSGSKGVIDALCMGRSLLALSPSEPSWTVLQKGVALVHSILEVSGDDDEEDDWPTLTLHIFPVLQALQEVIVHAPNPILRLQGYTSLTKVIKQALPVSTRFHSLDNLIRSCPYPSLVSLLLNCVKDEVARAWPKKKERAVKGPPSVDGIFGDICVAQDQPQPHSDFSADVCQSGAARSPFVSGEVLEVIGSVLRPAGGEPPQLPSQIDSVQGALNLYRFLLIREMSGKSNYTGVLSKATLQKMRSHWLLPLRELVAGVHLGIVVEGDEMAADMSLAIDSLQSVLHRCLELVEEALSVCTL